MCSVQCGDGDCMAEEAPSADEKKAAGLFRPGKSDCQKCRSEKATIQLRGKDVYCRGCFLKMSAHKFRSTLGKNRVMRQDDSVLIGFGGGESSTALLHLCSQGLEDANKRLLFSSSVIVVDEGVGKEDGDRKKSVSDAVAAAKRFPFPVFVAPLEAAASDTFPAKEVRSVGEDYEYILPDAGLNKIARTMLSGVKDSTARAALAKHLRRRLLVEATKAMGITKVFTAESSTSLAVALLSGVATGRGQQLPWDVGFADQRDPKVVVIRPMREFGHEEISLYNSLNGLAPVEARFKVEGGIDQLTREFVVGLQENFPATIPTIFRTGDKLRLDKSLNDDSGGGSNNSNKKNNACALCSGILDTEVRDALEATDFSRMVETNGQAGMEALATSTPGSSTSSSAADAVAKTVASVSDVLCYSCRLIASRMDSATLPEFVSKESERRRLADMRKDIEDFLL